MDAIGNPCFRRLALNPHPKAGRLVPSLPRRISGGGPPDLSFTLEILWGSVDRRDTVIILTISETIQEMAFPEHDGLPIQYCNITRDT